MITFIGFSPAWQQVYLVDSFCIGEVNRSPAAFAYASGKATNAAIVAAQLGGQRVQLTTIAGGPFGSLFESDVSRHDLTAVCLGPATTRVCTTIVSNSGVATELVQNAPEVDQSLVDAVVSDVREVRPKAIACCGSLPAGVPDNIYGELMALTSGPTVLDAAGPALLQALPAEPTLVKPNRSELLTTLGLDRTAPHDRTAIRDAMQTLLDAGAQAVLVTDGARPAVLLTDDGLEEFPVPEVRRMVNPIGAGDSLTGATTQALAAGRSLPDAIEIGLRAASEKCGRLRPEVDCEPRP